MRQTRPPRSLVAAHDTNQMIRSWALGKSLASAYTGASPAPAPPTPTRPISWQNHKMRNMCVAREEAGAEPGWRA